MREATYRKRVSRRDVGLLDRLTTRTLEHVTRFLNGQAHSDLRRGVSRLESDDVVLTQVELSPGTTLGLGYIRSLVSPSDVEHRLLTPLKGQAAGLATLAGCSPIHGYKDVTQSLLAGRAVVQQGDRLYSVFVASPDGRPITEPSTERAVFGAKDAFIELLDQNLALIRQHARDPDLRVELLKVGTRVPTTVAVLSVRGVADPDQHALVVHRIEAHPVARLRFTSQLVEPLFGRVWGPFLPVSFTERPDQVLDHLYLGRIAILADGSPFAAMMPKTWIDDLREEEDRLLSPVTRWFIRALRLLAAFLATALPGFYIAILTGNPNFLPGLLSITIASSRESVPYPLLTETLFMMITVDVLAESTVAMKGVLGPSISIVGSLIIGDAAVRANLVSNLSVIIAAGTALGTFVTPHYWSTYGYRLWKYPIMMLSAGLGILGWTTSVAWLINHLASSRTLGVSYASPVGQGRARWFAELLGVSPVGSTLPDPTSRP